MKRTWTHANIVRRAPRWPPWLAPHRAFVLESMIGGEHWRTRPMPPQSDNGPHAMLHTRPVSARFSTTTNEWQSELRRAERPMPRPFVVKLNTHPSELPRNHYGTRVPTPRLQQTVERQSAASLASPRPWRETSVASRTSSRALPKLRPNTARLPWGGGKPLPWMVCPDGAPSEALTPD